MRSHSMVIDPASINSLREQEKWPAPAARKDYADYLKAIAIFGVITVHVTAYHYHRFGEIHRVDWWIANILNCCSRHGAALFVMTAGCLCLGRRISVGSFYKKRLLRLLPAAIFWFALYICFSLYTNQLGKSDLVWFLKFGFFTNGYAAYYHLWYVPMFICLMFFVPFLNMFILGVKPRARDLQILILLLLLFSCAWKSSYIIEKTTGKEIVWFKLFVWYIGYLLTGFYIDTNGVTLKVSNRTIALIVFSVFILGASLNYLLCDRFNLISDYFVLSSEGPLVFIVTTMLFLLVRINKDRLKKLSVIRALSESSFGMYLIHPLYIYLFQAALPSARENGALYIPTVIVFVFAMSFLTIHNLRRITLFKFVT